jgi:hypothetical protein
MTWGAAPGRLHHGTDDAVGQMQAIESVFRFTRPWSAPSKHHTVHALDVAHARQSPGPPQKGSIAALPVASHATAASCALVADHVPGGSQLSNVPLRSFDRGVGHEVPPLQQNAAAQHCDPQALGVAVGHPVHFPALQTWPAAQA